MPHFAPRRAAALLAAAPLLAAAALATAGAGASSASATSSPASNSAAASHQALARVDARHLATIRSYDQAQPLLESNPTNPLAGRDFATYKGLADPDWAPYLAATGATKDALGYIANMPKAKWFGRWLTPDNIADKVHEYIANATADDPDALVQMTMFNMDPWERAACASLPTDDQVSAYQQYITNAAGAIGDTHVALILQPDGPMALCAPGGSKVYSDLIGWAAETFSALPNTSVYIEMGSTDWLHGDAATAVQLLLQDNIQVARGVAMDVTHFDTAGREVGFGTRIVHALARAGVPNKHFVVDTADSGAGFSGKWWYQHNPSTANFNNADPCETVGQKRCVTLGIPPTTDVTNPEWHLTAQHRSEAGVNCDAFLWISRPWLSADDELFHLDRALPEVATTPY